MATTATIPSLNRIAGQFTQEKPLAAIFKSDRRLRQALAALGEARRAAKIVDDAGGMFIDRQLYFDCQNLVCAIETFRFALPEFPEFDWLDIDDFECRVSPPVVRWIVLLLDYVLQAFHDVSADAGPTSSWDTETRLLCGITAMLRYFHGVIDSQVWMSEDEVKEMNSELAKRLRKVR